MVKDVGSATVIAPMIKDYIDVGIKNDDQLVKLSGVAKISETSHQMKTWNFAGLSEAEKKSC